MEAESRVAGAGRLRYLRLPRGHRFGLQPLYGAPEDDQSTDGGALASVACCQEGSRSNLARVTDSTQFRSGLQYLTNARTEAIRELTCRCQRRHAACGSDSEEVLGE